MKKLKCCSFLLVCLFFIACGSGEGGSTDEIAQLEQQLYTLMDEKEVDEETQDSVKAAIKSIKSEGSNERVIRYLNGQIDFYTEYQPQG